MTRSKRGIIICIRVGGTVREEEGTGPCVAALSIHVTHHHHPTQWNVIGFWLTSPLSNHETTALSKCAAIPTFQDRKRELTV